ncbi:hypothetical protein ABZP36_022195 [Zizania latifolia]
MDSSVRRRRFSGYRLCGPGPRPSKTEKTSQEEAAHSATAARSAGGSPRCRRSPLAPDAPPPPPPAIARPRPRPRSPRAGAPPCGLRPGARPAPAPARSAPRSPALARPRRASLPPPQLSPRRRAPLRAADMAPRRAGAPLWPTLSCAPYGQPQPGQALPTPRSSEQELRTAEPQMLHDDWTGKGLLICYLGASDAFAMLVAKVSTTGFWGLDLHEICQKQAPIFNPK